MENILKFKELYGTNKYLNKQLELSRNSPEHPIYHPEGTLSKHIDIVLERAFERPEKELHFAAMFHDITKSGWCPFLWEGQKGEMKILPEGNYWQNIHHAEQAVDFIMMEIKGQVPFYKYMKDNNVNGSTVIKIVKNHMKMKNYLKGEKGILGGLKESKRQIFKDSFTEVEWDLMYYFSTYCDNMLFNSNTYE